MMKKEPIMSQDAVRIRRMQWQDIPAALELSKSAGWNQLMSDWEFLMQTGERSNRVAVSNNQIAGTVTAINYTNRFWWIGMMLVDERFRRKGIGRTLLTSLMQELPAELPCRLDATPLGSKLYDTMDYRVESRLARFVRYQPVPINENGVTLACQKITRQKLDTIKAFDRTMFGMNRSTILNYVWNAGSEYAWYIKSEDGVLGYCLGRPGHRFDYLGPIIARNQRTAEALLANILVTFPQMPFAVDCYEDNQAWIQYLTSLGFIKERPLVRMCHGDYKQMEDPEHIFGISGPEFG
jgi:GNAT superfamily N-acetyltransferase